MRYWLNDLVKACVRKVGPETCSVFIDCNPSFSTYTELAMAACERLIIPCSSDGSSARAIDNVAALLYGHNVSIQHEEVNFSHTAEKFKMPLPVIHSVILNRSTQYSSKASKAFTAMFDEIKKRVEKFRKAEPGRFLNNKAVFDEMPDSHSVAIVCSHLGMPLYQLAPGKYEVHDTKPQVNSEPLNRYKDAVSRLIKTL